MEKIKGLIIKDILQLKTYRRTIVLYIALFILSSFSSEGASQMLLVFMVLAFGMFAIASFNYDASSRADKYILSLPLTKKEVVKAKYIFVIMATLLGALIGICNSKNDVRYWSSFNDYHYKLVWNSTCASRPNSIHI